MTPELYTEVVITRDIPEERVRRGDVGLFIEHLKHPHGGEDGAMIEMTVDGEWHLATVPLSAISAHESHESQEMDSAFGAD